MKVHTALAAASLLVLGLAWAAADTASLEARLSSKEKELAVLYADFWRTQYRVALGDTKATILPMAEAYRLGSLFDLRQKDGRLAPRVRGL